MSLKKGTSHPPPPHHPIPSSPGRKGYTFNHEASPLTQLNPPQIPSPPPSPST
jgi:hypothetical protein